MAYIFHGKVAIVTGASSGIGKAAAIAFAKSGASVALVGRDENKLKGVQDIITNNGGTSIVVRADLRDIKQIQNMVNSVIDRFGDIDILANIGAVRTSAVTSMVTEEHWDDVINTNLKGVFFTCQSVLKHMMHKKKGAIVNVTSSAAHYAILGMTAYAASKGGLVGVTRNIALEGARCGVRVNTVAPGPTSTEGVRSDFRAAGVTDAEMDSQDFWDTTREGRISSKRIPLGRWVKPDEVAAAILWLCSDDASALVGATIHVNGGNYMP